MDDKLKKTLFFAIIEHLKTGLPVASGIISEKCGASSSSVRDRMSRLEKDGYLKIIHTSSGRVPTAKAVRFFLNELLEIHENILKKKENIDEKYSAAAGDCDKLLLEIAGLFFHISANSEYRVIPQPQKAVFREMRLVLNADGAVSGAILASSGPVRSFNIEIENGVDQPFLDCVADSVNRCLKNKPLGEISGNVEKHIEEIIESRRREADFIAKYGAGLFNFTGNNESSCAGSASNINKALDAVSDFIGKADIEQNEKK